jgi:hypothetical protein
MSGYDIEIRERDGLVVVRQTRPGHDEPDTIHLLPDDCEAICAAGRRVAAAWQRAIAPEPESAGMWSGLLDAGFGPDDALGGPADAHGCGR